MVSPSSPACVAAPMVLKGCSIDPSPSREAWLSTMSTRGCAKAANERKTTKRLPISTRRLMVYARATGEVRKLLPACDLCYKGNHGFHTDEHPPRPIHARRSAGSRQQHVHCQRRRERLSTEAFRGRGDRVARAAQIATSEADTVLRLLPRAARADPAAGDVHAAQRRRDDGVALHRADRAR